MEKRYKAILFMLVAATLWSSGGLLIKLVAWNPVAIAGLRSFIAVVVLLFFFRGSHLSWSFPQMGGAVAYAITVTLFVTATKLTTAANAILLQYTAPIYVALFSAWFLNEKVKSFDWLTIIFVFCGLTLFFMDKLNSAGILGNILAIISGFSFGWLVLILRKYKSTSQLDAIIMGNCLAALTGMPFMFSGAPDVNSWIGLFTLGIIQLGLSYFLYSIAIRRVKAVEAVIIPMLEPVLNPLWVFLFIGETPGAWALAGGCIVVTAITIRGIAGAQAEKRNSNG